MKKFFSLFAAVLFAGGMFAATEMTCAEAREAALNGSTEEVTIEGYVTEYVEQWSSYKNVSFWMADEKDGGQVFEAFRVVCENEADAPKVGDKVRVTGTLTTYTKNDVVTPETAKGGTFEIIEKAGGDVPPVGDVITCAQAREAALNGSTEEVTIEGYVTEYVEQWSSYKNVSFWMADEKDGGQVFEAFRVVCENEADAPKVGDKVRVTGTLTTYTKNDVVTPETAKGGTFEIIEKAGGDVPPVGDVITCEEAAELALGGSTAEVTIEGYVTEMIEAWQEQYKNVSFWMADEKDGGQVFEAFRVVCENEADAPEVGDLVRVTGKLSLYNGTPETAKGGSFEIIEKSEGPGEGEFIELDVEYAEAYYIADEGIWQINLYKDYDPETEQVTYPDLYIGLYAKSATAIAGTYSLENEEIAFIEVDVADGKTVDAVEATDVVITHLGEGVYHYELEFLGDDGNTYILDVELETIAYDDEDFIDLLESLENVVLTEKAQKVVVDGAVYIIRDNKMFNMHGAQVR